MHPSTYEYLKPTDDQIATMVRVPRGYKPHHQGMGIKEISWLTETHLIAVKSRLRVEACVQTFSLRITDPIGRSVNVPVPEDWTMVSLRKAAEAQLALLGMG
jgi:hypothetical protein